MAFFDRFKKKNNQPEPEEPAGQSLPEEPVPETPEPQPQSMPQSVNTPPFQLHPHTVG